MLNNQKKNCADGDFVELLWFVLNRIILIP